MKAQLERAKGEAQITTEQARATAKEGLIQSIASKHQFVKPEQVSKLVGDRIVFDEQTKRFAVRNDDGSIAAGPDGKPVPVEAFISAFASENPHLIRGEVKLGTGSTESRQWNGEPNQADRLRQLFGRGSDAKVANLLAIRQPEEYRRLRREAVRLGLLK